MNSARNTLTQSRAWQALSKHARAAQPTLAERFAQDSARAADYSGEAGPLFVDYSRQTVGADTLTLLRRLAEERELAAQLQAVVRGETVNTTEQRSAAHNLLRQGNPGREIADMRAAMAALVNEVHSGRRRSATGKAYTHVVNIGIGGSDLGPRLAVDALGSAPKLSVRFVANIDPAVLTATMRECPAESTLFLVSSKSFSTDETLQNAHAAMDWLRGELGDCAKRQFLAITAKREKARAFGIDEALVFPEWVGGRFSVWSAIGLPIALAFGMETFEAFLAGGERIDRHVAENPEHNLPAICGLIDIWNRNFLDRRGLAVLPYAERLRLLPDYLQQLFMESQGKSVGIDGDTLNFSTGVTLFGSQGTNGQHSFYQLLHQGSDVIPCDFILPLRNPEAVGDQHERLIANGLGQSLVLANGQTEAEVFRKLTAEGIDKAQARTLARHKAMPGNRPSTTICIDSVNAETLGALIAFYEYRMLSASLIWGINPFDQWGVELGKVASRDLLERLDSGDTTGIDSTTAQLIARFRQAQQS